MNAMTTVRAVGPRFGAPLLLLPSEEDRGRFSRIAHASEAEAARRLGSRAPFADTWLARRRLSARQWLLLLACFELKLGGREAAQVAELSLPTIFRAYREIRLAIACRDPLWQPFALAHALRGAPLPELLRVTPPAFWTRVVPERGDAVPPLVVLPAFHREGFVYAAAGDGSALCWHASADGPRHRPARGNDPFGRYLASRLPCHFGVPRAAFPLFVKEYELRFNFRGGGLLDALIQAMSASAPA